MVAICRQGKKGTKHQPGKVLKKTISFHLLNHVQVFYEDNKNVMFTMRNQKSTKVTKERIIFELSMVVVVISNQSPSDGLIVIS